MQQIIHKKVNPIQWLFRYFRESKEEIRKVSWPSKQDTTKYSLIVIVLSIAVATFFAILDWVLSLGLEQLIQITS